MADDPSWLAALLVDPEIIALGLRVLDADQRAKQTDEMRSYYGYDRLSGAVIHTEASLAASRAAFARGAVAVAVGPATPWFVFSGVTTDMWWMLDPGRPEDGLLLALSAQH